MKYQINKKRPQPHAVISSGQNMVRLPLHYNKEGESMKPETQANAVKAFKWYLFGVITVLIVLTADQIKFYDRDGIKSWITISWTDSWDLQKHQKSGESKSRH